MDFLSSFLLFQFLFFFFCYSREHSLRCRYLPYLNDDEGARQTMKNRKQTTPFAGSDDSSCITRDWMIHIQSNQPCNIFQLKNECKICIKGKRKRILLPSDDDHHHHHLNRLLRIWENLVDSILQRNIIIMVYALFRKTPLATTN